MDKFLQSPSYLERMIQNHQKNKNSNNIKNFDESQKFFLKHNRNLFDISKNDQREMDQLEKKIENNKMQSYKKHLEEIKSQIENKEDLKKYHKDSFYNFKFYQPDSKLSREEAKKSFWNGKQLYLQNKERFGNHAIFNLIHHRSSKNLSQDIQKPNYISYQGENNTNYDTRRLFRNRRQNISRSTKLR